MLSATEVSLEKRFIILPSGLELKKRIGEWITRLSIELWRELLRFKNIAPTEKAHTPEIKIIVKVRAMNRFLLL